MLRVRNASLSSYVIFAGRRTAIMRVSMTTPDRQEHSGDGAAHDFGHDFDPLLTPWDPRPVRESGSVFDDADGLDRPRASIPPRLHAERHEDALWWDTPPAGPYVSSGRGTYAPRPAPAWYPEATEQPYAERLTEVQRRLREETIAIPRPHRRWLVTVREVAETLILAALIFLAVRASFQNFRVEGHSMDPSLADGEYLIVNKLTYAQIDLSFLDPLPFFDAGDDPVHYLWGSPDRGDVIVFRAPLSPNRDFIKRIIGVPGDTVEIQESTGKVLVNGQPLSEPYIQGTTGCAQSCKWTVPPAGDASRDACGSDKCYFVLGDNRQNSSDSRQGWLVPKENVVGKALITYWHEGSPEINVAPNHSVGITDEASAEQ
jgi:signal peptidase I